MENHVIAVITQTVNVNVMTREDKGKLYDEYLRQSDKLQRENSRLKSQYVINIPEDVEQRILENNVKIAELVKKLEKLFID
jgi:hypothetical protein